MKDAQNFLNLTDQISNKLEVWLQNSVKFIPNIVLALIVLVIFYFISRFIKKIMHHPLQRLINNRSMIKIAANLIFIFVFSTGLFIALELLNLEKTVTSILAGAGVIGIAIGFAFQEVATNFIAGMFIASNRPFSEGDTIAIGDQEGLVLDINLRATLIETYDGLEVMVPNRMMLNQVLKNFSHRRYRRVEVKCGVAYQSDLSFVQKVAIDSVKDFEFLSKEHETELFFNEFGDSSINFSLFVWFDIFADKKVTIKYIKHHVVMNLKLAFDANKIDIPFPIRTLNYPVKPS